MTLLGGLTPQQFLARHWQRRPQVVRGALPGFRDPVAADDLWALARLEGVESRLVLRKDGRRPRQVIDGPQRAHRPSKLPASHWTLLVQEVDHHVQPLLRCSRTSGSSRHGEWTM